MRLPWALVIPATLAAGCRSTPEPGPFVPPLLEPRVEHFAGTAIEGPTAAARVPALEPGAAWVVAWRAVPLEDQELLALAPLAAHLRLLTSTAVATPVLAAAGRLAAVRVGVAAAAGEARERLAALGAGQVGPPVTAQGVLVPGGTAVLSLGMHRVLVSRAEAPVATVAVADGPELAALATDLAPGGGSLLVLLPSPEGGAVVVEAAVALPPADGSLARAHDERVAAALAEMAARQQEARSRAEGLDERARARQELASAWRGLGDVTARRRALLLLAAARPAPFAEDLALLAADEALAALVADLPADPVEPEAAGWLIERAALRWAVAEMRKGTLAAEARAALLRLAGEAGHDASELEAAVAASHDVPGLLAHWRAVNRAELEAHSPAARVRAFDWLAARGEAPAGFDPLAAADARRRALAALAEDQGDR